MDLWCFGVMAKMPQYQNATTPIKLYYAKILRFGEHTVVKGSQALAMPLTSHSGDWQYANNLDKKLVLQQQLPQFLDYLNAQKLTAVLDLGRFSKDLEKGLFFQSSIPTGYGLGSSGALCAAIYDQYALNKTTNLIELKRIFGVLESYFHGQSSGMDPLVCYINQPLLIATKEKIQTVKIPSPKRKKEALFLIDTHIPRKTAPFVNGFLERCKDPQYEAQCSTLLVPLVNGAIMSLLKNNWQFLYQAFSQISSFQFDYFDFMIPDAFKDIWEEGLYEDAFKLKICGAGGGGYLLGISRDFDKTQQLLKGFSLLRVL